MDIIISTAPKTLTSDTNISNYILIFISDFKIPKRFGMEKILTEEVLDKLDMFQSIFRNMDEFGWWYLDGISEDVGTHLP